MDAMIYGLCIERLKHQISLAGRRKATPDDQRHIQLESYFVSGIDDIIDMLELYDIEDRSAQGLREKLDDLAGTASILVRSTLRFDYDADGVLGLYMLVESAEPAVTGAIR